MNDWIIWDGRSSECPVPAGTRCEIRFVSVDGGTEVESMDAAAAADLCWLHQRPGGSLQPGLQPGDIFAYRLIRSAAVVKATNPKDAVGVRKAPLSTIPMPVVAEVGVAMLEGALKYGRHNYRAAGVRASVYFDAVVGRHLLDWWEGEDLDADSGVSHITKAIAGLVVLRDSMMRGNWVDDRPPRSDPEYRSRLNALAAALVDRHAGDANPPHHYTQKDREHE